MSIIIEKIKSFFGSRPMLRFYRVVGFGVLSTILVALLNLVPQLKLSPEISSIVILFLTGAINAVDKFRRDLSSTEEQAKPVK
jgi:uncharacterized membrane protein YqjE